jgi:hypothetical protein
VALLIEPNLVCSSARHTRIPQLLTSLLFKRDPSSKPSSSTDSVKNLLVGVAPLDFPISPSPFLLYNWIKRCLAPTLMNKEVTVRQIVKRARTNKKQRDAMADGISVSQVDFVFQQYPAQRSRTVRLVQCLHRNRRGTV